MIRKKRNLVIPVVAFALLFGVQVSYACDGQWKSDERGTYWEYESGEYPADTWCWIDDDHDRIAECYYFDKDGYLLKGAITPDGYEVNGRGAWINDGEVQRKDLLQEKRGSLEQLDVKNGLSIFSPEEKQRMDDVLFEIPSEILNYHNRTGARVTFMGGEIDRYCDDTDESVAGLYYHDDHNIYVRRDPFEGETLAHELGHFVYYRSLPYWTDVDRSYLSSLYDTYLNTEGVSQGFVDESETFAKLYEYEKSDLRLLSETVKCLLNRAEDYCIERYYKEYR